MLEECESRKDCNVKWIHEILFNKNEQKVTASRAGSGVGGLR